MQIKNRRKFIVTPETIQFMTGINTQKIIVKNTSLRVQSFQVINPNQDHYKIQSGRKFTLAPGMSNVCIVSHLICTKCHKNQFNKLRIVSSQKQSILVNFLCPLEVQKQQKLIECLKQIDLGEFNFDLEKMIKIPIKNLTDANLKLNVFFSSLQSQNFKLELDKTQIILLKQRQIILVGNLNFSNGVQFMINLQVRITSQSNPSQISKTQRILIKGSALIKNQVLKNSNGKIIDTVFLKTLNGTQIDSQFFMQNCFRKDCTFKIIPQISSSNPNEFSQKWNESQIIFHQSAGEIQAFQSKKITYEIKTTPNLDDINFIEKFSKIDSNDQINLSKMKASKYFRKNIEINVKCIFTEKKNKKEETIASFKIKLNVTNPALRIKNKSHPDKQVFQIHNQTDLQIPYQIQNNTLYRQYPTKGLIKHQKEIIQFQWKKNKRPFSGTKTQMLKTFSLAYGKCNLYLKLPKYDLQLYNFIERENIRPSSSTIKQSLGLQKSQSMMLKRPFSALCTQMVAKKFHLIDQRDFYLQIPKFLPIEKLRNEDLEKVVISSGEKGNIICNTWNKQISAYFAGKGHLVLKPLKTYLLPYSLQLSTMSINDQQFQLQHRFSTLTLTNNFMNLKNINFSQPSYALISKELNFTFNLTKKQYFVQNSLGITNCSKQSIKAFLLTVEDEYFVSGQEGNKLIIRPNQTVNFKIRLFPTTPNKKQNKITRTLEFLIDGNKQHITCYGQLLTVDCQYSPKQLCFTDCHFGQQETQQKITLTNCGFNKFNYEVECPQYVTINYLQNSGTILGKGSIAIGIKFKPCVYLQNFKDYVKILIRGSHAIIIPLLIKTQKPNIVINEKQIDFGEGILGDTLQGCIEIENNNNRPIECKVDLNQTDLQLQNHLLQSLIPLQSNQKKVLKFFIKITKIGIVTNKISKPIFSIPGYGPIQSPKGFMYVGKQNIMEITPTGNFHLINVEELQSSYKLKLTSLINQKIELKTQLIPEKKFDQTFILSIQPPKFQILPYSEKQILMNCLISDLQKLKEIQRNYQLKIYRKGVTKPYTILKIKVNLPTPKLIIQPKELYFPIISLNHWNHRVFKIQNKGYKQIHFKIKKPVNIPFQLDVVPKFNSTINSNSNENKLTKLNNEAEVRVSFRSKNPISFQTFIQIQDNFGNINKVKFYGMTTNCPLLLSQTSGSMPLSAKSIHSTGSMPLLKTMSEFSGASIVDFDCFQNESQHGKFLNFWIGSLMPHMKKDQSFNQYLSKPQILLQFLSYFSIQINKSTQKPKLSQILFELRKLGIPLDIINSQELSNTTLSQWVKFVYILLSKRLIHPQCLKWVSKKAGQTFDNYDVAYPNCKKIITNLLNSIFFKVFKVKIAEYELIIQRLDPYLQFLLKIESKKHFILCLNILYFKFSNEQNEVIKSQELNHKLSIAHNIKYEKTLNWIISDTSPQIVSNTNGVTPHVNSSDHGYYFTLDRTHPQTEVTLSIKESSCIAILNSTLFEKCKFVEYQMQQIQPKIHSVTIQCEDKFTQEWVLQYNAPVDSQYKVEFVGDSQFKCKYNALGLIKVGKKIPISVTYTPTNLNLHQATLSIMNKHYKQIYNIKGKPLFSRNIQFEKNIKVCQGKRHFQIVQIPWEYNDPHLQKKNKDKQHDHKNEESHTQHEIPNLTLIEYNEKRKQFLNHKLSVVRHGKKQLTVKIKFQYEFNEIFKSLPLLYQITNQDKTQSKIIRLFIKVIPKPVNIEAEIRCKLQQSVSEKIPLQNLTQQKQTVLVQFFKSLQQAQKFDKYQAKNGGQYSQRTERNDSKQNTIKNDCQFRLSRTGKVHIEPEQLENILLIYRPDSLFETSCLVRVTYESSHNVVNYKFKGIPQFPSTLNEQILIRCKVQEKKTFKIPLKSLVRENTIFEVQTNIKQIIGKEKITLTSGQALQYPIQILSHHSGTLSGEVIFKSPQLTLVYPLQIIVDQNEELIQRYEVSARVRQMMILQLELHNKSNSDITYDVHWNHEYISCPQKFHIEKNCRKNLEVTYLPFSVGQFITKVKLYHPDLRQIIYELKMSAQQHEQFIEGPQIQLMEPYVFILPIKNPTNIDCFIEKPTLPQCMKIKTDDISFPARLNGGKTVKIQVVFNQKELSSTFQQRIKIKTDTIGQYNFLCQLNIHETKTMNDIDIFYRSQKTNTRIEMPFKTQFINQYNQKIDFHLEYKGGENHKLIQDFKLISPMQFTMEPFDTFQIEGYIKLNIPSKGERTLGNISSNEDLVNPIQLVLSTVKNKIKYQFIFPIKLIRVYENPHPIYFKSNAYQMKRVSVNLLVIGQVTKWTVSNLSQDFIKSSFGFVTLSNHQHFLEVVINKPMKYDGHITFQNNKNQAQKIPLRFEIGEPKYQPVVINSNVGEKATVQIKLKNGKGPWKCELTNNKTEQFAVQPMEGQFIEQKGESIAKINFIYFPNDYSGIKRAKVAITSQHGCYYFNLMGKFKSLKK